MNPRLTTTIRAKRITQLSIVMSIMSIYLVASSSAQSLFDGSFSANWSIDGRGANFGVITSGGQTLSGGNPDKFLTMNAASRPFTSAFDVWAINHSFVWNTQIQGEFVLNLSFDVRLISQTNLPSYGINLFIAALQDTPVHTMRGAPLMLFTSSEWTHIDIHGLKKADFASTIEELWNFDRDLDSQGGGPTKFGIAALTVQDNSISPASFSIGIDNWSITAMPVPEVAVGNYLWLSIVLFLSHRKRHIKSAS